MTTPSTADLLRKARALIERPEAWTKDVAARNAAGVAVIATSESAVCWCAVGAVERITGSAMAGYYDAESALDMAVEGIFSVDEDDQDGEALISHYNDTHTHAEVLAAFDRAIAIAEAGVS